MNVNIKKVYIRIARISNEISWVLSQIPYFILPENCLFWSVFCRTWTEYGEIRSISPYSVQMREIRTRITPNRDTFYTVNDSKFKISESLVSLELTSALNSSLNEYNLRIHWRLSMILKISKKVYEVMFFDMQKYTYSKSVFNTLNIEIKHEC